MQNRNKVLWLEPCARWAVSRYYEGRYICLVQDSYLNDPDDALYALRQLQVPATQENLDIYFPYNKRGQRCPTYSFMQLWYHDLRKNDPVTTAGV